MFHSSENKANPRRISELGVVVQCFALARNIEQTESLFLSIFRKINQNMQKPPLQCLPEVEISVQSFVASPSRAKAMGC